MSKSNVTCLVILLLFGTAVLGQEKLDYPVSKRGDLVENIHGVDVADPYRWLEEDVRQSADVATWVGRQNEVTQAFLSSIPEREGIRKRLKELWNYEKFSAPFRGGKSWYFYRNDGLQNQRVLYRLAADGEDPQLVLDPNTWSKDGTVAMAGVSFSPDGRTMAYAIQKAGSDWRTWKFRDLASGSDLKGALHWLKFGGLAWTKDSKGVFYSRYAKPKEGSEFQNLNLNQRLYDHRLDRPQAKDVLVYARPDQPKWGFASTVSADGRFLIIQVWKGTGRKHRVLYKDLFEPYGMPVELVQRFEYEYNFIGNEGSVLFFKSDKNAALGRIIAVDIDDPHGSEKEVVPESKNALVGASIVGNLFVLRYLEDASSKVALHRLDGRFLRKVELPGLGTVGGFSGWRGDVDSYYSFSSFTTPPSIYHYDFLTGKSKLQRQAKVNFVPSDFELRQVFVTSKDGTKVPMFLAAKKGLKQDGSNPTLLYGYGGFNISLTPRFSVSRLAWLEMGGVLAVANLRGGGEYGEEWHEAGTKTKKQNVFDDFIACAEWLIEEKFTTSRKLGIQGGSNGGLLVGACMTQRPKLFGACLPAVGVMDMLRFHKFTAGRFWVDDYGCADNPEEFKALLAYSPYHNVKANVSYPATMVTTADTDDRVVPGHSFKFAARLQKNHTGKVPVLIRIETRAGHGAGKPTSKRIEEAADLWSFLVKNLGMTLQEN